MLLRSNISDTQLNKLQKIIIFNGKKITNQAPNPINELEMFLTQRYLSKEEL